MRSKTTDLFQLWRNVFALLKRAAPILSLLVVLITLIEAIMGIMVLYAIKLLVDTISAQLSTQDGGNFIEILHMLALTGAAFLTAAFFQSAANILRMRQGLLVSDHVDGEIHERAISVDLRYYESPNYYDDLTRARQGGSQRPARAVSNTITLFRATLMLFAIFVLIASIEWRLIPILAIPIGLALLVRLHFTRRLFEWRMSRAQMERRANYLDWLMTNERHAKDLRLNRIGPFLRNQFLSFRGTIRKGEIRIEQRRQLSELAFSMTAAIVFIGASAWLLNQSVQQTRPIGDVVLFVLLLRRAEGTSQEFVGNISMIVDDHLYLRRLFNFLSVQSGITAPANPSPTPKAIENGFSLSNVWFKYEGAKDFSLRGISMEVRPKQIVAVVGENGSGKTTLIKILTRLYDPSSGLIELDNVDIKKFDPTEYRKMLSVIFQDYTAYAETAENNIKFGDISLPSNLDKVIEAAQKSEAASFLENLPHSYQTPLTKLFDDGQDLSIGQWQRIALARAFYPHSKLVILDEPTSAVDPKAEFEVFENFRIKLGDRSALIISHRLSTVRQADYIYVLKNGTVSEHGSHDELMSISGDYAELFEKQAKYYR